MANVERLRAVVEFIEQQQLNKNFTFEMGTWIDLDVVENDPIPDHPIRYTEWKCGTAACLAGSAALYANVPIEFNEYGEAVGVLSDGQDAMIEFWASDYFGLTYSEAEEIFYCSASTVDDLKAHINWTLEEDVFPDQP